MGVEEVGRVRERVGYRLKRGLLGRPLVTDRLGDERLSNPVALGVSAPACISSSAYGTEEMLLELLPVFGLTTFVLVLPITGVVVGILVLLTLSYREVVQVYTKAGGYLLQRWDQFQRGHISLELYECCDRRLGRASLGVAQPHRERRWRGARDSKTGLRPADVHHG